MKNTGKWPLVWVAGVLAGWVGTSALARVEADGRSKEASGSASLVVVSQGSENFVYVLDPKDKALSVYRFDPRKEKLKLAAARRYAADHQLSEYNNEGTTVAEIERMTRSR